MQSGPFGSLADFLNSQFLSSLISLIVGLPLIIGLFRNARNSKELVDNATSEDANRIRQKARISVEQIDKEKHSGPADDQSKADISLSSVSESKSTPVKPSTSFPWAPTGVQPPSGETPSPAARDQSAKSRNRHGEVTQLYKRAQATLRQLATNETDGRYRRTYTRLLEDEDYAALSYALLERERISVGKFNLFVHMDKIVQSMEKLPVDDGIVDLFTKYFKEFSDAQ
jgi:hypothetical protein